MSLLPHHHLHPTTLHTPPHHYPHLHVWLHFQSSTVTSPLPTHNQSGLASLWHLSVISSIVLSSAFVFTDVFYHLFHLGKAVKFWSGIMSNLLNCLFAHLGTGILRPSIAEVPRSPISSSVPAARRNTTLSRTRVHSTRIGVRPVSPSKTLTSSHSSSTPGGNGVLISPPLIPSSQATYSGYPLLSPLSFAPLQLCIYRRRQTKTRLLT